MKLLFPESYFLTDLTLKILNKYHLCKKHQSNLVSTELSENIWLIKSYNNLRWEVYSQNPSQRQTGFKDFLQDAAFPGRLYTDIDTCDSLCLNVFFMLSKYDLPTERNVKFAFTVWHGFLHFLHL